MKYHGQKQFKEEKFHFRSGLQRAKSTIAVWLQEQEVKRSHLIHTQEAEKEQEMGREGQPSKPLPERCFL